MRESALAEPYPLGAAGWGPEAGKGFWASRWAEDWTDRRTKGQAPQLKAMPLGGNAALTVSAEARLRLDSYTNAQLRPDNDYEQGLLRGVLGADLRLCSHVRIYGELGTGRVAGRRAVAAANFQNEASLQQLLVEMRRRMGPFLAGAMVGRQEFADGPRQLVSLSDGPNLHRTWNGVRLYAHARQFRLGAVDLRATRPGRGLFDETVNRAERLQGINAGVVLANGAGTTAYLEPFWLHTANSAFRSGGRSGFDGRDTWGVRWWGRSGRVQFDWTLAQQGGRSLDRRVDAWALFAVQSVGLSERGWKPRLTLRVDLASGDRAPGPQRGFNPLYASSGYLGEGSFLSLSNLALVTPGMAMAPTPSTSVSVEYGFARRLEVRDAVYAGQMRAYAGTAGVPGREVGGLLRATASWSVTTRLTLFTDCEHLAAGEVLRRAHLRSGSYVHLGATIRY